jgi:hypothetical protein
MRASLDYLAEQLVLSNSGIPTDHTAFPIWESALTESGKVRKNPAGIPGASVAANTLVDTLQPYHVPTPQNELQMLALLSRLCNIDKHRHLHLIVGRIFDPAVVLVSQSSGRALSLPRTFHEFFPLKDNTEIALVPSNGAELGTEVQMYGNIPTFVAFQEPPALKGGDIARILDMFLESLKVSFIPSFEPFLR